VTDRERTGLRWRSDAIDDRTAAVPDRAEEAGVTPVVPADKWRGGTPVLRPHGRPAGEGDPSTLFHKIVMIRNKLQNARTAGQRLDLPDDAKVKPRATSPAATVSLTTFNAVRGGRGSVQRRGE
jgi:hypothetical protein